jgi:iron complex outermembrane receptor protein/hemoglobin/transferrin/lactoferrin receptor protein
MGARAIRWRAVALFVAVGASSSAAQAGDPIEEVRVAGTRETGLETKALSIARRVEFEEHLPRSAPDAMRYEPGVFVQQTSHGQGAPIVRGLYGSRVLIAIDGVRLNNSTFRQGPNQYFFTLDAQTIDSVTVVRGGASTLFGTAALGGAFLVKPLAPQFADTGEGLSVHPKVRGQFRSADSQWAGRVSTELRTEKVAVSVGAGYTDAGLLRAGGVVNNPSDGRPAEVPRFDRDGVTQLGTGYRIGAADATLRVKVSRDLVAIAAAQLFRQTDTPRTDLCPPPFGVIGDCLVIDEQYRTMAYVGLDGRLGAAAKKVKLRASYQRQHELATRTRPLSHVRNSGIDNVSTYGVSLSSETEKLRLGGNQWMDFFWGADAYIDKVESSAWVNFTDTGQVFPYARGQYLDGSLYSTMGGYARGELNVGKVLTTVAGGRIGRAAASLAADAESGNPKATRSWATSAAELRVLARPAPWLFFSFGGDYSFRAPNLTDLSQRQQTGPGYQIDNPSVGPERQWTVEAGMGIRSEKVRFDAWAYRAAIDGYLTLMPKSIGDCPPGPSAESCAASWSRYQLVNAASLSTIEGVEGALKLFPLPWLRIQATAAFARGEGPNPSGAGGAVAFGTTRETAPRVPLSRVPPMNGTLDIRASLPKGFFAGSSLRWALLQSRLALNDLTDYRIPIGGTPGFAVLDLRAGYRYRKSVVLLAQLENLFDAAYRTHGSAVNGPGRGISVSLEASY